MSAHAEMESRPRTRGARFPSGRCEGRRPSLRRIAAALTLLGGLLLSGSPGAAAEKDVVRPFEAAAGSVEPTPLDALVAAAQRKRGLEPARPCSDEVFIRRVFVDLIGTLPKPAEVRTFLADRRPDRRERLVDTLFERDEFADYWSLKWCDALRVKAEFPINLWPNAVQTYHRWVRDAVRENRPYDQFARALLTSSGSNFRFPAVNFYRAVLDRQPTTLAAAVAQTFMGTRVEPWPQERLEGMARFFSRVAYKPTREWKEEIVLLDPAPSGPLDAVFPDGTEVRIGPDDDPREAFANWLITPENPWFARAAVNRIWYWLFGRGVVHEPDDLRPDNPPLIPGLLEALEMELVDSGWDVRHVLRVIVRSRTYQQSPIPRVEHPDAAALFACYPVRRLDAEVLIDALCWIGGKGETYSSAIPEPFTWVPEAQRTIALSDGSITSPFLELFGRPPRDTGRASERTNAPTDAQRLHLLNSSDVLRRIQQSPALRKAMRDARWRPPAIIRSTYLLLLSRFPTDQELETAGTYFKAEGRGSQEATLDLAWALVNSKEFLYRH